VLGVEAGVSRPDRVARQIGGRLSIFPRVAHRTHRYMPAALLASQFATLEDPKDAIVIDVATPIPEKIAQIRAAIGMEKNAHSP
jgi:gluconate kinase